jgi:hypothetical protein
MAVLVNLSNLSNASMILFAKTMKIVGKMALAIIRYGIGISFVLVIQPFNLHLSSVLKFKRVLIATMMKIVGKVAFAHFHMGDTGIAVFVNLSNASMVLFGLMTKIVGKMVFAIHCNMIFHKTFLKNITRFMMKIYEEIFFFSFQGRGICVCPPSPPMTTSMASPPTTAPPPPMPTTAPPKQCQQGYTCLRQIDCGKGFCNLDVGAINSPGAW